MRIAYLTGDLDLVSDVDVDIPILSEAFEDAGIQVDLVNWNDESVDYGNYRAVLVRSPWDYHLKTERWESFLSRLSSAVEVANPPQVLRWNLNKRYLGELAAEGVPVVPTAFCSTVPEVASALAAHGGNRVVVKPVVSAGSRDTALLDATSPDASALAASILHRGVDVMIQPAVASVQTQGEVAALAFGGVVSHWVHKGPILQDGGGLIGGTYVEELSPYEPEPERVECVQSVLAALAGKGASWGLAKPLPYARIDTVVGADGKMMLLEAELFEPSFFLDIDPLAARRFVTSFVSYLSD